MDENKKELLIRNMVDNLPTLRKRLGMSQGDLAAMIGVGRSSLAAIERKNAR